LRLPCRSVRIAKARGEHAPFSARAIDFEHGGAIGFDLHAIVADIAVGADGRIKLAPIGGRGKVLGPVMVEGTSRQVRELHAGGGDFGVAGAVEKFHDRIGVGDIEIVADERHAERRVQSLEEGGSGFRNAVAVGIPQQRDAVGARRTGAGAAHDQFSDPALDALVLVGPLRRVGFGHQHIAIGQDIDRSRMIEPSGKCIHRHSVGRNRLAAGGPANGLGDVDGRYQRFFRFAERGLGAKGLPDRGGFLIVAAGQRQSEAHGKGRKQTIPVKRKSVVHTVLADGVT
jgi:hypothetical protein